MWRKLNREPPPQGYAVSSAGEAGDRQQLQRFRESEHLSCLCVAELVERQASPPERIASKPAYLLEHTAENFTVVPNVVSERDDPAMERQGGRQILALEGEAPQLHRE